jgi:hypothetical protein
VNGQLHVLAGLLPGKKHGTHWIVGRVGPTAGLGDVEKRKLLTLLDSNPDSPVVQPVTSRYTDCANLAPALSFVHCDIGKEKYHIPGEEGVLLLLLKA